MQALCSPSDTANVHSSGSLERPMGTILKGLGAGEKRQQGPLRGEQERAGYFASITNLL